MVDEYVQVECDGDKITLTKITTPEAKNTKKSLAIEEFIVVLQYWVNNNFKENPEEIADFYIKSAIK